MKQRILTAIIGIIVAVPIILYGSWPFIILAYILATIALFELIRMYQPNQPVFYLSVASIFLWLLLIPKEEIVIQSYTMTKLELLLVLSIVLLISSVISKNTFTFDDASFVLFATLYIGFSFYFIIDTRLIGLHYFLYILFLIWATDSGAYFIGKYFGKRKLWPAISPNKTIAGAVGGVIFAIVIALIFQAIYSFDRSFLSMILLAIIISILGQIGDLVASAMKRHYKVKDSGNIFPGHGGILDRLDSFIFVVFVLHVFQFI